MGAVQAAFGLNLEHTRDARPSRLQWIAGSATLALPWLLALAVFLPHSLTLRDWLIDDAGISFAYARSLAEGHGLVAQAGAAPVEGFSNPLWTLLLSLFFATGTFDAAWTPKVLSFGLVAASFGLLAWDRGRSWWDAAAATFTLLLLSLNTSFVVWTSSGLENPLLVFLATLSCILASRALATGERRLGRAAGVVAGLLALTRPDAIVYTAALRRTFVDLGLPRLNP